MGIYKNRYQAKKYVAGGEVIVKVEGGYTIMSISQYEVWRRQK